MHVHLVPWFAQFGAPELSVKGSRAALPEVKVEASKTHLILLPHQHTFKTQFLDK